VPGHITRDGMIAATGTDIGCSAWITMDQDRIDAFADVTQDHQFIHIDPVRAAKTPFGGTVAHGMLTLSMLSAMAYDVLPVIEGQSTSVNYGFDRVRFVSPVRSGTRIRGTFHLTEAQMRGRDKLMCRFAVTVDIDGAARPALTADWQVLYLF